MSVLTFSNGILLIIGLFSGLAFAPTFIFPALITLSILLCSIYKSETSKSAFIKGYIFGFGHFLSSMYWISIGVSVYINDFWWAIPFALFGLPLVLAFFIAIPSFISWKMRNSCYFQFVFCMSWVLFEWIRSWIFTGLPWNLLGYALAFSDVLIQPASIVGTYGLSLAVVYISTGFFYFLIKQNSQFRKSIILSLILISIMSIFGILQLKEYSTDFSTISVRLVQPSIPQKAKWDEKEFWKNLNLLISLSTNLTPQPDLIIWSEAALVVPYRYPPIMHKIIEMLQNSKSILITGGISDNELVGDEYQIYTTLQAINSNGNLLFEYHKSHLVPFGEYMPFKSILPIKKLTPGFLDYTPGNAGLVTLEQPQIRIKPLICYEAIFPNLVRTSNLDADVIVNVTNDTWYGNSSGPYQHLHITRLRAIENGLPILRVGNNGISAIIDPLGRITKQLGLNKVGVIDGFIPLKIQNPTPYSLFGNLIIMLISIVVLLIQPLITFMRRLYLKSQGKPCSLTG